MIFKPVFSVIAIALLIFCLAWPAMAKMPWEVWDYSKEKPVRGGYYRTASSVDVGLLNPNHWPVLDWLVINYFFEKFLITDGSYRPVNWMMDGWEYPTPTTCIMKVKRGITFHDGTQFDAYAIKYQIDWIMDPVNGTWSKGWLKPLKSVSVVDDYTVKWEFKQPWAAFLGIIANVPGYAISPKALEQDNILRQAKNLKKKIAEAKKKNDSNLVAKLERQAVIINKKAEGAVSSDVNPVGTGKWLLEDRSKGNYIKVKRNPNWWFGKSIGQPDMPYHDGMVTTIIPDPSVRLANLRAGKIDVMTLTKQQYQMVKNARNLNVYISPVNHVRALRFNHAKGPATDIRVRQAVSLAIDRKALIVAAEMGMGRPATSLYPEDHWASNPNLKPWPYDPEKAKRLLAEAGYANGLVLKGYMRNDTQSKTWTEIIKNMLLKVNVDWQVDVLDAVATSDRMKNLEYDLAGGGWSWIYDPDLQASGLYHPDGGFNFGRTNNTKAIALIEAGRAEVDLDKRKQIYWDLQQTLYDNVEDAWLFYEMWPTAYNKNVRGYDFENSKKHKEIWSWSHPLWFKNGKASR
jgi:peptide/nickel transport system substrate-binding protein